MVILLVVLVIWLLGFVVRMGEGGSRGRWYHWYPSRGWPASPRRRLRGQRRLLRYHTGGWQPPRIAGQAIAQTHCHQHAVMGYDADQALLADAGVDLDVLDVPSRDRMPRSRWWRGLPGLRP